jgi:predicted RecB family nuclease
MSKTTCENGHVHFKTSDCPVCPICEQNKKPKDGFLSNLAAPARRALQNTGILTPEDLAKHTKKELLALHGIGPSSIPALEKTLFEVGLNFKA